MSQYRDASRPPPYVYSSLAQENDFHCNHPCTCQYLDDRSSYDKLQYDLYVLDKPLTIPTVSSVPGWDRTI